MWHVKSIVQQVCFHANIFPLVVILYQISLASSTLQCNYTIRKLLNFTIHIQNKISPHIPLQYNTYSKDIPINFWTFHNEKKWYLIPEQSYCPKEHAFALNNGKHCCKYFKRSDNTTLNAICNGDPLLVEDPVECCPREAYIECEDPQGCVSHTLHYGNYLILLFHCTIKHSVGCLWLKWESIFSTFLTFTKFV